MVCGRLTLASLQPQCAAALQPRRVRDRRARQCRPVSRSFRVCVAAGSTDQPSSQQPQPQQEQQPGPTAIEASRSYAVLRAARHGDVYAAAMVGPAAQLPAGPAEPLDVATRFVDAALLHCVNTINYNRTSSTARETNQVVLVGDGFDTRPFRLNWPAGTVIFSVAPGEVHEIAERQLLAAAAADPGFRARVPRGCLLRRVAADLSCPGAVEAALEAAGLRGDRLSVWAWQLGGCAGAYASDPHALLTAVSGMAALESTVVGELQGSMDAGSIANLLAGYGLLGAAVSQEDAAAQLPMLEQEAAMAAGVSIGEKAGQGSAVEAARAEGTGASAGSAEGKVQQQQQQQQQWQGQEPPKLFLARQKRLSLAEMDLWASHGAAQEEAEESDGILPFS